MMNNDADDDQDNDEIKESKGGDGELKKPDWCKNYKKGQETIQDITQSL